ncbi:MAG: exodeoxyribonuclease VII small subunit [Rickettsiales bacterium]|jgi:exodeoxyribonuclease VII small subunit|nr:exodeoxyribonuclease VII small subunit [Rickettsiales bacterium]
MSKSSPAEPQTNLESVSFEDALKELESIVRKLEGGTADLESSIQDYLRGTELKNYCDQKLKEARMKVEAIMKTQDGGLATRPLDAA